MNIRKNIALILLISMAGLSSFSVQAQNEKQDFEKKADELQKNLQQVQLENERLKKAVEIAEKNALANKEEAKRQSLFAEIQKNGSIRM